MVRVPERGHHPVDFVWATQTAGRCLRPPADLPAAQRRGSGTISPVGSEAMNTSFQYTTFAQILHHLLEAGREEAARRGLSILVSATVDIPSAEPALLFGRARG